jgi:hypothetical protein
VGSALLGSYWVWKDARTWSGRPRRWLALTLVGGVLGLTAYLIAAAIVVLISAASILGARRRRTNSS